MSVEERLAAIHSTGYWRVNIRPSRFEPRRIPSLSECWDIVESSKVRLRGWDYPHIEHGERVNGDDWISSGSDWARHLEYWRLYQSGQFIHHFAMWEDYERPNRQPAPERYLEPLGVLYRLTEIFEFSARLGERDVLRPSAEFSIRLVDVNGRCLMFWDISRILRGDYVSALDQISFCESVRQDKLLSRAPEIALDASIAIYERFNWTNPPRDVFAEEQKKFLERRLTRG
jgi:hypothetical protein